MRILVTGASGWIGSASVEQLIAGGHHVLGLARSDESAAKVAKLGAEVVRGSLDDLASLRAAAVLAEGVVHLGYNHDFAQMTAAARTDRAAIDVFADVLQGTGGPLLIASGTLGLAPGRVGTEEDTPDTALHPRIADAACTSGLAARGIRAIVMRSEARGILSTLLALSRTRHVPPTTIATLHVGLGEIAPALTALKRALTVRDTRLIHLRVDDPSSSRPVRRQGPSRAIPRVRDTLN